ncbi:hypothetical protein C8J57DRAFT_121120 [Mycena rebaudengoi]|nr:hypothetical protein C8J57DRAFT_121120 [Mycena rebaudengoi]
MNDSEPRTGSRSLSLDDESFFSNEHLSYVPDEGPQEPFPEFVVYAPEYQPSSQKRGYLLSDDDDDSSDSEPGQKRARTRSLSPLSFTTSSPDMSIKSDSQLELPWDMYDFNHLRHHSETTLYIDKTSCIGQLSDKFRHILLRPPRFGKTTFLSTLTEYYDIQGAAQFTERFGSLAVVTATPDAIPPHNQHLCLNFALSRIGVVSEAEEIESRLASYVSCKLETFIFTYQTELQLCEPEKFFQHADPQGQPDIVDLFAQLFELVRTSGYTLFVGIDDYDAPIRSYSFIHLQHPEIRELYAPPRAIEHLLESHFWGPLLAGAGVIDKLFITGTLSILGSPASVNLRMLDLKVDPALYSCCGFTEQEAIKFVRAFLDVPPDVASLRRACGNTPSAKARWTSLSSIPNNSSSTLLRWRRSLSSGSPQNRFHSCPAYSPFFPKSLMPLRR